MFTGIVQHIGIVREVVQTPNGRRITIDVTGWGQNPSPGDSVAISGVCLTVVTSGSGSLSFDVVPETLSLTTLAGLSPGDSVNIEGALCVGDPIGGHFVQGHVDAVGTVGETAQRDGEYRVRVLTPRSMTELVTPKGSITIDGVSLTIASVDNDAFEVALIPATLEKTTLRSLGAGDTCNLESDILTRTVVHALKSMQA